MISSGNLSSRARGTITGKLSVFRLRSTFIDFLNVEYEESVTVAVIEAEAEAFSMLTNLKEYNFSLDKQRILYYCFT